MSIENMVIGPFRINIWDDCTDSDALYEYEGESYRQGIRIDFRDPEESWLPIDGDGWTNIKHKIHDGTMEQALNWAKQYLARITGDTTFKLAGG